MEDRVHFGSKIGALLRGLIPGRASWPIDARQSRFILYLLVLACVAGWRYIPRPWTPTYTLSTAHFVVYSTATPDQTQATAEKLELLYVAYSNRFSRLATFDLNHPKLKVNLFKDRQEFRRINPGLGWAEAFYRKPYCRAYFSQEEVNPYHWMLHEAVHQLNQEVAHLTLAKWLSEGIAEYFSTSRFSSGKLELGRIDPNCDEVFRRSRSWLVQAASTALAMRRQNCFSTLYHNRA